MPNNTTLHPTSSDRSHLVDLLVFKGAPINHDTERPISILVNDGFVVGFSPARLQPAWAAYRVAGFDRDVDYDRPHLYYEDTRLEQGHRVGPETFGRLDNIQYHVGHMVPNEVINRQFGRMAQLQTFLMSNMSPQRSTLNNGVWLDLENKIRNIEDTNNKDHVWAIVGPIFGDAPPTIDRPNGSSVPIPEAYFCVVVDPFRYPWDRRSNVDVACFRIPQDADRHTNLDAFLVDITDVEHATQLSFFPQWGGQPAPAGPAGAPRGSMESRHRLLRQL